MQTTQLNIQDKLPLTCSRTGTCCHGKSVLINPWELVCLAKEKKMTPKEFSALYCEFGGIRLRFNGKPGWKQQKACSLYVDSFGCSVHLGRPLACRLYPLGRQIQSDEVHYMFEGKEFPCLEGCPEVSDLPQFSVESYLKGQQTQLFEKAQDAYLDLMQNLADIAFVLLLDTGLASSGDTETLTQWQKMGNETPEMLVQKIGSQWLDALLFPDILENVDDPILFIQKHNELLQSKAQSTFENIQTNQELHEASVLMMCTALHIARGIGANPSILAEHWVATAKGFGGLQ